MTFKDGYRTIDKATGKVLSTRHAKLIGETTTETEEIRLYKSNQGFYFFHKATEKGQTAWSISDEDASAWINENLTQNGEAKTIEIPKKQDSKWAYVPTTETASVSDDYKKIVKNLKSSGVTLEEIARAFLD